jgi:hypothetical protein
MGVLLRCLMSFLEGVSRDCAFFELGIDGGGHTFLRAL